MLDSSHRNSLQYGITVLRRLDFNKEVSLSLSLSLSLSHVLMHSLQYIINSTYGADASALVQITESAFSTDNMHAILQSQTPADTM